MEPIEMLLGKKTRRLYNIRRTVMQMLRDRNYSVAGNEIEEFEEKYGRKTAGEKLYFNRAKRNDSSDRGRAGIDEIRNLVVLMNSENIFRAILVTELGFTPKARSLLSESLGKFHLEFFRAEELIANITEHSLVPRHRVLTIEERKALLEYYTVKETQLTRICVTDPVAKYFGVRRGEIVKIIRTSETAGRFVTHGYAV